MAENKKKKKQGPFLRDVVVLIHFEGHPLSTDHVSEELRWSTLRGLLFGREKKLVILSDHKRECDFKMNDLRKQVEADDYHKWIQIDPVKYPTIHSIETLLYAKNTIARRVIFGGTNTKGCVLDQTPYSAIPWAKEGHNVKVYLPMCIEYQAAGINQKERNIVAFADFWRKSKEAGVVQSIDFIAELERMNDSQEE